MNRPKKLKIEVRAVQSPSQIHITAKERHIFACRNCGNKYYSFYYFCPQCLGFVQSVEAQATSLRIVAIPANKLREASEWIQTLSGVTDRDFSKSLQHLPFVFIEKSDPAVALEWKELLAIEGIEAELFASQPKPGKKSKYPPMFVSNAPLPHILPPSIENGARQTAAHLQNASLRMQWAEAVLAGFKILFLCYKDDPTLRVLFADFIFQIPQRLEEGIHALDTTYKGREEAFAPHIRRMSKDFERMRKEIENVRRTVQQQL